ncbi:HK97 gp10 family phage protein [Oceanobacillus neutriphilus]|uniref:HK97 gp10 family phage protein n=1 Tax=Oceanobacillus neutriphilus TaxID=531815 RepID=A0ABQ2NY70_9BACI|nr:HK97 gp10 family phage protein [Oceanobacillus neutriphilus]GGP13564.1 hypothetical protein GCM10011346_34060 [Oceanobacillus neutriphilus]
MSGFKVTVEGLDKVMNDFSDKGRRAQDRADKVTETYTRKMANEASGNAPVKTGDLRADIAASPKRLGKASWQYGSTLDYAEIQEFTHRSKKGFIRKSIWDNESDYQRSIKREIKR